MGENSRRFAFSIFPARFNEFTGLAALGSRRNDEEEGLGVSPLRIASLW